MDFTLNIFLGSYVGANERNLHCVKATQSRVAFVSHVSLPEIGDYTDPENFENKKNRTPEKCSKSLASAGLAIFP